MIEPPSRPVPAAERAPPFSEPAPEALGEVARGAVREQVEMMARFRRGIVSTTVMLKDLTCFGARVEGVGMLEVDEMVSLTLPGCRPSLAFVAWANEHCAGLEFIDPLGEDLFAELVARYGLGASGE